jgi:NTE family protein
MNAKRVSLFFLAVLVLSGCVTFPDRNDPLTSYSPDYGYRYRNIAVGEDDSDSLLVMLTFSGGGTRAAALAYGVLEVLRDTPIYWEGKSRTLLDEVDVISSVSGGSLTAAYYGLFDHRIFDDFKDDVLYRNIQGNLIRSLLSPVNAIKMLSISYGRTDLLAENLNRRIFDHQTYGDLLAQNRRPYIIINTTDMERRRRLGFTQGTFDLFYSDLSTYPIGNAVAASAAFPGLLAPMIIHNYPKEEGFQAPDWTLACQRAPSGFIPDDWTGYLNNAERSNINLLDGGVSDNLGLLPVIMAFDGHYSDDLITAGPPDTALRKVVIITVNAAGSTKRSLDLTAGLPGLLDTLLVAGTTPIASFSQAQIAYLRQQIAHREQLREIKRELERQTEAQGVHIQIPTLDVPDIDFHFIEVAFDQLACPEARERLSHIPTSFSLPKEDVHQVCESAKTILASNPDFIRLLATLRPPETANP